MAIIIDAPVLDYVFQPLCDRLAVFGVTPFQTARFFLDGAAVTLLAGIALWVIDMHTKHGLDMWGTSSITCMMVLSIAFMMVFQRWFLYRVERMNKPGLMNPGRSVLLPSRLIAISLLVSHWLDVSTEPSWAHIIGFLGYVWWFLSCYFASCSQRPPKFQFARRRSWLRFRVA